MSESETRDPRAYVRLAARIREAVGAGTYQPGAPVPSITVLCQETGHARQTCSKALGALVKEGLLIRWPGRGYYVAGAARRQDRLAGRFDGFPERERGPRAGGRFAA